MTTLPVTGLRPGTPHERLPHDGCRPVKPRRKYSSEERPLWSTQPDYGPSRITLNASCLLERTAAVVFGQPTRPFPVQPDTQKKKTQPHIFHMEVMLSEANAPCACHGDYDDPRRMEPFTGARILGTIARLKNVPPPT